MSDRITKCFAKAKAEGRGAFVSYLTMGYPTLRQSEDAVDDLVAGGVDIVELGVPFSDPFADGAVIRSAAYKALENGDGFIKAMWCGDEACEDEVKEKTGVGSRCIPFAQENLSDKCVCCGKPAKKMVYWGRAY